MTLPPGRVIESPSSGAAPSVGVASMLLGRAFLDYSVFLGEPVQGQHLGVLIVEVAVGVTVFAVVLNIFFVLSGRRRRQ